MPANQRKITMADPFFDQADRARIHAGVDEILDKALSMGPNVAAFEREFVEMTGAKHAIAMNACTSTLEAALLGLGLQAGDEVIVPCETFIATGMAVHLAGGHPVFADVSAQTLCLSLDSVRSKQSERTKGVIVVYMAGHIPSDIVALRRWCDENGLFLIEDAAHAPGAELDGRQAGTFGHAGCFSFFPSKVMTSGEGGMLTTSDDRLAAFARSYQHRGRDLSAPGEQYAMPGRNVRMTEMAALLGRVQLARLPEFLAERRRVARGYEAGLRDEPRVQLILPEQATASSYWKVPLLLADSYDRSRLAEKMHKAGIAVDWAYEPALHLQPVFRALYGTTEGQLPASEALMIRHLCLPCHPRVSDEDVRYIVGVLIEALDAQDTERDR